jgi:hypothetical protein
MLSICQWIHQTQLSIAIRESIWVYPIADVLHCVGILLVAGTIVVVDLRLLGFGLRGSQYPAWCAKSCRGLWAGLASCSSRE